MKKWKWSFVLMLVMMAFQSHAADVDMSQIDRNIRTSGSKSIMFQRNNSAREEQLRRERAEAEARAEARAKEQAAQESKLKKEQPVFRPYNLFGRGYKIAAIINGDMVSNKDLQERANLFSLTTGMLVNAKNKDMIIEKVMQNTIDEKIKIQEANKQNVHVSSEEVTEAYRNFEKSNGMPSGKFQNILKQYQVSSNTFMTQIKANLLWNKLVTRRMGQNIDVSVKEVEDEFMRIKKDMDTPKYMVSEIVIKKKDAAHIDELVEILQNDPRFELYAVQFSQSPSAPSGGKLGWVSQGQLAAPLDAVIRNLREGKVSNAVPYRSDYYIFKMDKIYNPKANKKDLPTEDEVRAFIKNRKVDEMANKYIRDLRNRAIVERKF